MSDGVKRDLTPTEAVQLYIEDKRTDGLTERTIGTYQSELKAFIEWCETEGIETIGEIDGLDMKRYKTALSSDYARSTVGNRLRTAKDLLQWCVSVNAAQREVVEQIEIERVNDVRTSMVEPEEAESILNRLERFHYASKNHVTFLLLWTAGCRLGAIRALDVSDVGDGFEDVTGPALRLRHRPKSGTGLKNGESAERYVAITPEIQETVKDYVGVNRPEVTDQYGRKPLLATNQGRAALSTLRTILYAVTRPCWYSNNCPEGRDVEACEAAQTLRDARECPENNSPHDVRRGRLTEYRREGIGPRESGDSGAIRS
jgi:site-specific recombinase XerD